MATWYVDSAAAGTGAGTSWVNACTTMAAAITLSAAGDDFNILSTSAETQGSALTWTFKGTAAARNRVFSCDNTNAPAQASDILAGASATTTGAFGMTISGCVTIKGMTLNVGTGTTAANSNIGTASSLHDIKLEDCTINHLVTTGNGLCKIGNVSGNGCKVEFKNTQVNFNGGAAGSGFQLLGGEFKWTNTPLNAVGGTTAATLTALVISTINQPGSRYFDGLDLSALGSAKKIFSGFSGSGAYAQLVNCTLTSGITITATPTMSDCGVDVYVSDGSATGYRVERYRYEGTSTTETTVVNAASDGVTPYSVKIATTANASRTSPFELISIPVWVDATGGSKTATFSCVTDLNVDATALKNSDLWVDAQVLDNASFPIAAPYTNAPATALTAGSTLSAGSWTTTTGMTTPDKRQIQLTFTPAISGYVRFGVKVARASLTSLRVDTDIPVA